MTSLFPRLDNDVAALRLQCLQLAMKLTPGVGLDVEDIVKAAATFSRYVIEGVQACSQDAPAPATDADSADETGLTVFQTAQVLKIVAAALDEERGMVRISLQRPLA